MSCPRKFKHSKKPSARNMLHWSMDLSNSIRKTTSSEPRSCWNSQHSTCVVRGRARNPKPLAPLCRSVQYGTSAAGHSFKGHGPTNPCFQEEHFAEKASDQGVFRTSSHRRPTDARQGSLWRVGCRLTGEKDRSEHGRGCRSQQTCVPELAGPEIGKSVAAG